LGGGGGEANYDDIKQRGPSVIYSISEKGTYPLPIFVLLHFITISVRFFVKILRFFCHK
jgi:hypothetical protein